MNSTPGSVSYNGLTLTERLKIESNTSITYTTTSASTLTLVFDSSFTGTIKVDNVSYTASAGIVTASIAAGSHTITKGSVANLFYISTVYSGTTLKMAAVAETTTPESAKIILYPNPVSSTLYLSDSEQKVQKVLIYNISGNLVVNSGNSESIDTSGLIPGTYLAKIYTVDGSFNQTLIKK